MTPEEKYNQYLNTIASLTLALDTHDDSIKQSLGYKNAIDRAVNELNRLAKDEFSQFIANDPASYDDKMNALRDELAVFPDIQDNVLPSIAVPLAPTGTGSTGGTAAPAPAAAQTAAEPSQSDLTKETKMATFGKYMGSYNPDSAMDQAKMKVVDAALDDFQKQTGKSFDINNSEDLKVMQGIMNTAYQSPEYKSAANVGKSKPTPSKGKVTSSKDQATIPFGGSNVNAFKKVGKAYVAASDEDVELANSGKLQLYINNPKRGQGELGKPVYSAVRMRSGSARPQSKQPGLLGTASNLAGDFFRSADKFSREPRK